MELAGVFSISFNELWSMTFPEINARLRGFRELHGVEPDDTPTWSEVEEMLELHPDGPLKSEMKKRHKRNMARLRDGHC